MKKSIIRTMIIISTCAIVVFAVFAVISISGSSRALKSVIKERAYYEAVKCANQLSMIFENAEGAVDTMTTVAENEFDLNAFYNDAGYLNKYMNELSPIIKESLLYVEDAAGLYLTFNPDLTDYRETYEIWYSLDESGKPVYTDATRNGIFLEAFFDYEAPHMQYYFKAAKAAGKGIWEGPGYDPDIEKSVLTYSKAVYVEDVLIGVVGVDIYDNDTVDIISRMEVENDGKVFLLDENYEQMVSSQKGINVDKEVWSGCRNYMGSREKGSINIKVDDNKEYLISYSILSNGWYLAILSDKDACFQPVTINRNLIIILSIIMVILVIFVAYFAINKFAGPVKKATVLLKQMEMETETEGITKERLKNEENIEKLVQIQIENQRKKDLIYAHQSRLAQAGEMLSGIIHQWKQPLNKLSIILGNLRDARNFGELTDGELERSIERSEEIITSMAETINEFRAYLEPDREKEFFEISKVLNSVIDLVEDKLTINNIVVNVTYDREYKTYGYRNALYHILLNIITNAIEALEENEAGHRYIKISVEQCIQKEKMIQISIYNNGGHISESVEKELFASYVTTKAQKGGSGLGLAISKNLVEQSMGGSIELENKDEGVLCTIYIEESEKNDEE